MINCYWVVKSEDVTRTGSVSRWVIVTGGIVAASKVPCIWKGKIEFKVERKVIRIVGAFIVYYLIRIIVA